MQAALDEAASALQNNCVPVGAIIVLNNEIIARAHNGPKHKKLDHAEILCINQALNSLQQPDLSKATIFVTVKPCAMCMHAIKLARIGNLVFGCSNNNEPLPKVEVIEGICESEAKALMKKFFEAKR